ncbi:MAG: ribonuclease III [Gammaproteobacteria bacterium]|nr:ribonuclease III [Gammaproteobacteria bacterium]
MNKSDIYYEDFIILVESKFNHTFKDEKLIIAAITHKSFSKDNYERLEFLGDAVIQLIVTELLISKYKKIDEGILTRERQRLVSRRALNNFAKKMQLDQVVISKKNTINFKKSLLLADVFESIVGAIYLDANYDKCKRILSKLFLHEIKNNEEIGKKDPKTQLQEYTQAKNYALPSYKKTKLTSPDHKPRFKVSCKIDAFKQSYSVTSNTVKEGEQQVARIILRKLNEK